jgi:pimeloyl-ACP methyl ester carboxylesterase
MKASQLARDVRPARLPPAPELAQLDTQPLFVTRAGVSLELKLHRARGARWGAPALLMLHGGNSSSLIFQTPRGGLAGYLRELGFDVWLLEWRACPFVLDPLLEGEPLNGSAQAERELINLDAGACEDIPAALRVIRSQIADSASLGILGHCLAGAVVAMAVARGQLEPYRVSSVLLLTLGLFCQVPWYGWLKAEDRLLERILRNDPGCRSIHPACPEQWPADMAAAYRKWPGTWLPEGPDLLRALSFMVGAPYANQRVAAGFHGPELARQFGPMHMGLYLHASQIVRRGYCAALNAPELAGAREASDLRPEHFRDKQVTLIAAAENRIWHRDSIDRMYEWLRNHGCANSTKHVLPGYNLQELLWGAQAQNQVYPLVAAALRTVDLGSALPRAAE